jgi:hypothetical protein
VTLYYEGTIRPDDVKIFDVPVPAEITKAKGKKRVVVTLAYDPPVSAVHRDRPAGVQLTWGLARGDVPERTLHTAIASEAENELADGEEKTKKKSPFMRGGLPSRMQQRGTVQKNVFEWSHGSHGDTYRLAVTAKSVRPAHAATAQSFAVVVTLETEDERVNVFSLVRTRLAAGRVRVRIGGP